jgi:hypothetical protein
MSCYASIKEHIAIDQVECLNEDPDHTVGSIFSSSPSDFLLSDIDPQLLISIPFRSPVKLSGIKFIWRDDLDKESLPESISLLINRVSLGFMDAESLAPTQKIRYEELLSNEIIPLRYVLFQNVVSLQLFVDSNIGGVNKTELGRIELYGSVGENMNMKEFKKIKDDE